MKRLFVILGILLLIGFFSLHFMNNQTNVATGAPPYGESEDAVPHIDPLAWLKTWTRPAGPAKVGLQVGHWKSNELPEELAKLRDNTGTSGGGKSEMEINLAIAEETARILESRGVVVDLLPATIPEKYWADVFVSIHADGSESSSTTGYKVASPRRDIGGGATELVNHLEHAYEAATGLIRDPNITRNMKGYYAFSWWRFDHAIHPMTTAAIVETGFLTNPADRRIILDQPTVAAEGIANGILAYLIEQKLLTT